MSADIFFFMALALALGYKHSYDADHLVAVSNLLTRSQNVKKAAIMSVSWAIGHMTTATIVTVLLYVFRESLLKDFFNNFDLAVAVMLLVIGVLGLLVEFGYLRGIHFDRVHNWLHRRTEGAAPTDGTGAHTHLGLRHVHRTMLGIGIVHGLASNDELLVLFVASFGVTTLLGLLGGVGLFSIGVVLGMVVFALGISYPISWWGSARVRRAVNVIAATLSIVYAVYLFLGFEGVNLLPIL